MFKPLLSRPILSCGGVDRVFDTVGNTETIEAGLRVLRGGGTFNLLGIGEPKKIDWTPVWFREITVRGVYGYQTEEYEGSREHDFDLALRLHAEGRIDIAPLVTHKFPLDDWQQGLDVALNKGRHQAIKIAFHP
jgi:threonine dehydrogenase-like Zn-dependent dehydrogenase